MPGAAFQGVGTWEHYIRRGFKMCYCRRNHQMNDMLCIDVCKEIYIFWVIFMNCFLSYTTVHDRTPPFLKGKARPSQSG